MAEKLIKDGIPAAAIHGNKSQSARTKALSQFKDGAMPVLVATDIAARGLDIDQLPQVVNFELPNVPEDYVHRIGRTGRAGATGAAISLVDREEMKYLRDIERLIKREIPKVEAEGFVPSANPEPEAPRPPRPQQQRRSQGSGQGQRQGQGQRRDNRANGEGQATNNPRRNDQRNAAGGNRSQQPREGNRQNAQPGNANQQAQKPAKHLSEAARHQAMPQPALFSPKPIPRNRGR